MNFVNKLSEWLEKHLMPVATVIGSQRHLASVRDGFIATLAVNLTGAMAVLVNGVIFKPDSILGRAMADNASYQEGTQAFFNTYVLPFMGRIWWATLAIISIFLVVSISYSLAKSYEVDGCAAAITGVAAFFAVMPEGNDIAGGVVKLMSSDAADAVAIPVAEGAVATIGTWGQIPIGAFGSNQMFLSLIIALISTEIFVKVTKAGWTIKMPEQVPPAVSKAFSAIIPAALSIIFFSVVGVIFTNFLDISFPAFINKTIQDPLVKLGQSPIAYLGMIAISQILWFFGLHGSNMIDPAMNTMYKPPLYENIEAFKNGIEPPHILTRNFLDIYGMHGGSGATLGLLIAIYLFSKKQEEKELFKIAVAPGLFQINEPVIFGLPMVLNPLMFIPFLLAPIISVGFAYVMTSIGFAGKICVETAWVTPPVISAYLGTGGNWQAALVAAITFLFSIAFYIPFIIAGNKIAAKQEQA